MKTMCQRLLVVLIICAAALTSFAKEKTVDQLIAELSSPKPNVVVSALQNLEKSYPTDVNAQAKIKPLLADPRATVKRKAARVLGVMNAEVSSEDLKNIVTLLSGDKGEKTDGLKALRGLKAQSTISQITPLLKDPDKNVMRDAIRKLAVLGDKSLVPTIQPFLTVPDLAVQKDAADAIAILKEK